MFELNLINLLEFCAQTVSLLFLWSWQAALLLALTFLIVYLNRSRTAEIRHKIWLAGLVAVALLPIWTLVSQSALSNQTTDLFSDIEKFPSSLLLLAVNINNSFVQLNFGIFDYLMILACGLWITGVLVYLVRYFVSNRRLKEIISKSEPLAARIYNEFEVSGIFIPANVKLRSSAEISNPTLAGFLRHFILFPAGIEEWTNQTERNAIIKHELAHLERKDSFIRIFQALLEAVFFFHPVIRYALNQLSFERELACDEKVIRSGMKKDKYAEVILKVAERDILSRERLQLTFTTKKQLKRRINKIMKNNNQSLSKKWRFLLLAKTAFLLALLVWFVTPDQVVGQSLSISNQISSFSKADDKTTEKFKHLYELMKEAMLKGDKAAFENFFADDYAAVSARGMTMTKQEVIDVHIQKPTAGTNLEKVEFSEMQVKSYGETVIVTYLAEMGGIHNNIKFSQKARITDVWKKDGEKWQSIASHASTVK